MKKGMGKVLSLMLVVVFLVIGCTPADVKKEEADNSGQDTQQQDDQQQDKTGEEKTKIIVWTFQRHDMDYVAEVVDNYNATNTDNIEIEIEFMTDNFDNNLDLAFQSKQAPDVFRVKAQTVTPYVKKNMAMPLDAFLTDAELERYGDMVGVDRLNAVDGKIYTLPYTGSPFRLIYNKGVFAKAGLDPEQPPKTMDEMVEMANTITEKLSKEGIYGIAANMKNPFSALFRSLDVVAHRSNAFPYKPDIEEYDFTKYGEVASQFAKMYAAGSYFPGAEGLDIDPMRAQFAQGNIGMYLSADWEIGVYDGQFPTEEEWVAVPAPSMVLGETYPTPVQSAGLGWAMSSQTKYPEEAWKVLSIFQDKDYQIDYSEKGYGIMITPEVAQAAKPAEKYGAEFFAPTQDDKVFSPPPHDAGLVIEGESYWDVFSEVIMGGKDVDEAVEEMNEKYNSALKAAKEKGEF